MAETRKCTPAAHLVNKEGFRSHHRMGSVGYFVQVVVHHPPSAKKALFPFLIPLKWGKGLPAANTEPLHTSPLYVYRVGAPFDFLPFHSSRQRRGGIDLGGEIGATIPFSHFCGMEEEESGESVNRSGEVPFSLCLLFFPRGGGGESCQGQRGGEELSKCFFFLRREKMGRERVVGRKS